MKQKTFTELLDHYMKILPQLTKEEADFVENICKMSDESRSAFLMAKKMFEEND